MTEAVKAVFSEVFELESIPDDFSKETTDLWDSLRHLNLVVELEEKFNTSFTPDEIATLDSLDKAVRLLQSK